MTDMTVDAIMDIWVTWGNTDGTEGRGSNFPFCISDSYEAARRLGRKKYVQGGDCPVTKEIAYKINGKWNAPFYLVRSTPEDIKLRDRRIAKEKALDKARAAGLTEEDIKALL